MVSIIYMYRCKLLRDVRAIKTCLLENVSSLFSSSGILQRKAPVTARSLVNDCLPGIWVMLIYHASLNIDDQDPAVPDVITTMSMGLGKHWSHGPFYNKYQLGRHRDYRETSNIRRTLVGNKIVDHSDIVGASPVGAAPTTSSISTKHLVPRDSAKTAVRQYDNLLCAGIWCTLY